MNTRHSQRLIRKRRIRVHVLGTAERPRLALYRSNTGLFAQVIDDETSATLIGKRIRGTNIQTGKALGEQIAQKSKEQRIAVMVFDRSGYRYHGVVAAFVDAVRSGGITV